MINTMDITKDKWQAIFSISEVSIIENEIKNSPKDIEFFIENVKNQIRLKGCLITTSKEDMIDAISDVKQKADILSIYFSAIHNRPINFCLDGISQIKFKDETKKEIKQFSIDTILHRPEKLDFNNAAFIGIYKNRDEKIIRQLSNFKNALDRKNIIDKIFYYWKVIEDEIPERQRSANKFISSHLWVRHLAIHATVDNKEYMQTIETKLDGKNYLSPENIDEIKKEFEDIKKECRKIINKYI